MTLLQRRRAHLQRWPGSTLVADTATVWLAGYLPRGGGTAGAVAALPLAWLTRAASWQLQLVSGLVATIVCIGVGSAYCRHSARADPQEIVLDELLGCWIALSFVEWGALSVIAAFALFRLLDIFKPWPIGLAERLHGGAGVMLDDVVAGIIAGGGIAALTRLS